jgi:Raf kinase inhibitor-like YbhB/YbcL family protein
MPNASRFYRNRLESCPFEPLELQGTRAVQRQVIPALILALAAASCGATDRVTEQSPNGEAAVENATLSKLELTSTAFQNGQPIPVQFTCDGANQSPLLAWGEPPAGTKSFAITIDDPDAPSGTFRHWAVFDIPASARSIAAGQEIGTQATNDKGSLGYTGPCPPKGNPPHHYHFRLFALDVDKLGLSPTAKVKDVEDAAAKHTIAQGELIGTYQRR